MSQPGLPGFITTTECSDVWMWNKHTLNSSGTYNAILGFSLNVQLQNSIAWGGEKGIIRGNKSILQPCGENGANRYAFTATKQTSYSLMSTVVSNSLNSVMKTVWVTGCFTKAFAEDVLGRFPQICVCRRDGHCAWGKKDTQVFPISSK